jgi:hypothetical protein
VATQHETVLVELSRLTDLCAACDFAGQQRPIARFGTPDNPQRLSPGVSYGVCHEADENTACQELIQVSLP